MRPLFNIHRWAAALMLTAFAATAIAPAAQAGHRSRRYKPDPGYCPPPVVEHVYHAPRRVVYVERHSDAAPLFAGLIGGLIIGTAIAHAATPAYEPAHYYWDPWCHERFASLTVYHSHFRHHYHPRVVRMISVENGDCVDTWRWRDGNWRSDSGVEWRYSARVHEDWDD